MSNKTTPKPASSGSGKRPSTRKPAATAKPATAKRGRSEPPASTLPVPAAPKAKRAAPSPKPVLALVAPKRPRGSARAPSSPQAARKQSSLLIYVTQTPEVPSLAPGGHAALRPYEPPRTREAARSAIALVEKLNHLASAPQSALWGLLPGDFEARTGLSLSDFASAIEQRPGFDLYFVSAHPALEAIHHNPWRAVDTSNPGFCATAAKVLEAAGLPVSVLDAVTPSPLFATGHLMVATPSFWTSYLRFVNGVVDRGLAGVSPPLAKALAAPPAQPGQMTVLDLIVARLPGVFLMTADAAPWKTCKLRLPAQEAKLNSHLKALRSLKDSALESQGNALLECWLAYRHLYLLHTQGADWIKAKAAQLAPGRLLRASTLNSIQVERLDIPSTTPPTVPATSTRSRS